MCYFLSQESVNSVLLWNYAVTSFSPLGQRVTVPEHSQWDKQSRVLNLVELQNRGEIIYSKDNIDQSPNFICDQNK